MVRLWVGDSGVWCACADDGAYRQFVRRPLHGRKKEGRVLLVPVPVGVAVTVVVTVVVAVAVCATGDMRLQQGSVL